MALPAAIQRQVDEATAAQAAATQQQAQQAVGVITDPSQLAPANDVTSAPQQSVDNPPPVQAPTEDWQQKYRSLLGRHAKETGELQATSKAYESQLMNMQRQLDALAQSQKRDEAKEKQTVDPKDVENFGADMIEMVQRYAEQIFQSMDGRITAIEKQLTGVSDRTEVTLEQQFYASLNGLVPDWERVNSDSRWLEWLAEVDPVYGAQRQAALDDARKNLNVQRVANVFNAFKTSHPVKQQESLANQVAPNSASAPVVSTQATKQIWASKAVEKFYSEVAKGRYNGREDEAARIEAEINMAAAEGRIR